MYKIILLALLAGASLVAPATELYKWTDESGKVHYTDKPPPKDAKSSERKKVSGNLKQEEALPFDTQEAARKNPVTLYTFQGCGEPCESGEALLKKRGIPHTLKNRKEDMPDVKRLTGGDKLPVLVVGNQVPLQGFEVYAWDELLDAAGYPKANPRKPAAAPKPPPAEGTAQ